MNSIAGCREIESLCRRRAASDRVHCWKWLGEADRWNSLAHRESLPACRIIRCTPVPWLWD
jgi:hypothetical protein